MACRNDAAFRASLLASGLVRERDFECPLGARIGQTEGLPEPPSIHRPKMGLGDVIEKMAKPIARALKLGCLDAGGKLRSNSPCAKRREAANRFGRRIGL